MNSDRQLAVECEPLIFRFLVPNVEQSRRLLGAKVETRSAEPAVEVLRLKPNRPGIEAIGCRQVGAEQSITGEAGAPEHYAGKLLPRFPNEQQRDWFSVLIRTVDDVTRRWQSGIVPTLAFNDELQPRILLSF